MNFHRQEFSIFRDTKSKRVGTSSLALVLFIAQVTPSFATIDNTATVNGTYGLGAVTATSLQVTVPVVLADPKFTISKSAGAPTIAFGSDPLITDAGDKITFTYTITNTGNVTLTNVAPTDVGPKFNTIAGTGLPMTFSPAPVTLTPTGPSSSQIFTSTYTLTALDAYRAAGVSAGVSNTASAVASPPTGPVINPVSNATATTTIVAGPKLSIIKDKVLDDVNGTVPGRAEVGEYIDYTYAVTNIGNVAISNISITDFHEGADLPALTVKNEALTTIGPMTGSVDATTPLNNGIWTTIQAGATVTFTYHHLVTQAEVDGG